MSGIIAVFNLDGAPADGEILAAMCYAVPEHAYHGQQIRLFGQVGLAHQHLWVTPEEIGEEQPLYDADSGLAITADARIDNRDVLFDKLRIERKQGQELSDATLILKAYQRWGETCTDQLGGDFAFVIWDANQQRLFAARDGMGNRGLVYWESKQFVLLATDISHLLAHPAVPAILNEAKIADLLFSRYTNNTSTYYVGIQHIPPAHRLVADSKNTRVARYWDFDPAVGIRYKTDEEYAEHFRQLLTEAVRSRLRATGPAALSLSGGLDSTSLAAILAGLPLPESNHGRLWSYSNVFDEFSECDERQYIDQTVDRFDLNATYINGDAEWTFRDIETWPSTRDFISTDPYPRLPKGIAASAGKDNVRVLFSGVFGDSLFEGSRFWLADMIRSWRLSQAASTSIRYMNAINWNKVILNEGIYRVVPKYLRRSLRRLSVSQQYTPAYINSDFAHKHAESTSSYQSRDYFPTNNEFFNARRRGLQMSIFAEGLSIARRFQAKYGIEFQCPYRDRRIAEYVISVPADKLGFPKHNRYLMRQAMQNRIPEDIYARNGRTIFVALMDKGLLHVERRTADRILDSPQTVEMGYICDEWLSSQKMPATFRVAGSVIIWKCICLELWLQEFW